MAETPYIPTLNEFISFARARNFARANRFLVNFSLPAGLLGTYGFGDVTGLTVLCEEAAFPGKVITPRPLRINSMTEHRAHTADYMGDSITFQFLVDNTWLPRKVFEQWMELCVGGPETSREVGFYGDYISNIGIYALVPATPDLAGADNRPTPSDLLLNSGLEGGGVADNIYNRAKRLADDQLDKLKSKGGTYIDPKATDLLRDTQRILNKYSGGTDPNSDIPAEKAVWGMTLHEAWPRLINVQQASYNTPGFHKLNVTFTYKYWKSDVVEDLKVESEKMSSTVLDRVTVDGIAGRLDREEKIRNGTKNMLRTGLKKINL